MDHPVAKKATPGSDESDLRSQEYWLLSETTQEKDFPEFVQAMRLQDDTKERVPTAVINFREDLKVATTFSSSEELENHLDGKVMGFFQGLFILEDLCRNTVEILGSRFKFPPSFFSVHWTDPDLNTDMVDQPSLKKLSSVLSTQIPATPSLDSLRRERGLSTWTLQRSQEQRGSVFTAF